MPIILITGLPGEGKTLYTITKVRERAKEENRQVYYHNIKDLKLDWVRLENPADWIDSVKVPDGALLVFDEAQEAFPPRTSGSKVPDFVQELAKHRHRGLDMYFITQDPGLIDRFVRELVGNHRHVHRSFGAQSARVYNWDHCVNDPQSRTERGNSLQTDVFFYPKETFDLYTSATLHTVKRKLPRILTLWLPLLVGSVLGLGALLWWRSTHKHVEDAKAMLEAAKIKHGGGNGSGPGVSDQWRVQGWYGGKLDGVVVLVGNDGRLRYMLMPRVTINIGRSIAVVLDGGEVVTEFSGDPDEDGHKKVEKP